MHTNQVPGHVPAGAVIGSRVRNREGERLGEIKEVMLDYERGRVAYAVLSFGGLLGLGEKLFALPWPALTLDAAAGEFVVDIDRVRLEDAPGFFKGNWPQQADRDFIDRVHLYYGYRAFGAV